MVNPQGSTVFSQKIPNHIFYGLLQMMNARHPYANVHWPFVPQIGLGLLSLGQSAGGLAANTPARDSTKEWSIPRPTVLYRRLENIISRLV